LIVDLAVFGAAPLALAVLFALLALVFVVGLTRGA
jgi:hypothetical protein